MPNINLKVFYTAKLLHNYLVAMTTLFPYQSGSLLIHIVTTNTCAKYELIVLSYNFVTADLSYCHGNSISIVTR